jgi:hypothetical protein
MATVQARQAPSFLIQNKRPSLSTVTGKGSGLPNRYILHGVEGWGKTTFGAKFPSPIFIQTRQETGLDTLIDAGRLPDIPHFPGEAGSWSELLGMIDALIEDEHSYRTFVLDTLNGAERLCHEAVCDREFDGIWGDKGFGGYQRGFEVSLSDWRVFLGKLDRLRNERKMTIILLCHTKVATFKNPEGPDYDRYQPDCNAKTWGLTHKWSDVVLFGNYEVVVSGGTTGDKAKKGKAFGQTRMMYTERHASYDAKNRLGLPAEIEMGSTPDEGWQNFAAAVRAGRATAQTAGQGEQSNG